MLYFVTGLPGASKTLNTIKMVKESHEFQNRPIFVNHIDDLSVPAWQNIDDDDMRNWYDFPLGAVIICDEAYRIFPNLKRGATLPEHYEKLAEIRHYGITLLLITQSASDIDVFVRRKASRHYHYERFYGSSLVNRVEFRLTSGAIVDTDKTVHREVAERSKITIDKKYFKYYKSAEVHTVSKNFPLKRLYIAFFALFVVISSSFYAYQSFTSKGQVSSTVPQSSNVDSQISNLNSSSSYSSSTEQSQTVYDFSPRVEGMPWTAPVYDQVLQIKSAPLPKACVYFSQRNLCVCYSQQSTPVDVPTDVCKQITHKGFFDFSVDESSDARRRDTRQQNDFNQTSSNDDQTATQTSDKPSKPIYQHADPSWPKPV